MSIIYVATVAVVCTQAESEHRQECIYSPLHLKE